MKTLKHMVSRVSVEPIELIMPFRVMWKGLNLLVKQKTLRNGLGVKAILNDISGYFESGQILAIMGPSGCGKSTLLGCISGNRKKGVSGSITISTNLNMKFAFIVQENYILERLTVKESLIFASKLKNESTVDHNFIASEIIKSLNLENCADIRPDRCSGGQLKRVLIGIELVSKPNILILDEPTTGLDSVTTWQLIHTLIDLTQQSEPVAVVITIHQPSAKLFNLFNKIYLLSKNGECIYFGSPANIVKHFNDYGLQCSKFANPSDFALEVASEEHDSVKLLVLSLITKVEGLEFSEEKFTINVQNDKRILNQIYYLTLRSLITMIRDPFMLPLRFFGFIICSILLSILFGTDSGHLSGCPQNFRIESGDNLIEKYKSVSADVFENYAGITFVCLFGWFAGIFPVLLQFPSELNIFLKEYHNGFYSVFSYFVSKVLSDLPFNLLLPNLASLIVYYMTGQYSVPFWRVTNFAYIFLLISFNSSALGFLIGALLAKYPTAIAFLGMLSLVPITLLSGIMIRLSAMPKVFKWLTHLNYMRFGLTASILNIYGFGRCADTSMIIHNQTHWLDSISTEQMLEIYSSDKLDTELIISSVDQLIGKIGNTEDNRSIVLKYFTLFDSDYNYSIVSLYLHIIVFRFLTYLIIHKTIDSIS